MKKKSPKFPFWSSVSKFFVRTPQARGPIAKPALRPDFERLEDRVTPVATFAQGAGGELLLANFLANDSVSIVKSSPTQIQISLAGDSWVGTDGTPVGVAGNGNPT